MFAVVSPSGKYHGHTESEASAKELAIVKDGKGTIRLLSDAEWQQVVYNPELRVILCATLGKETYSAS